MAVHIINSERPRLFDQALLQTIQNAFARGAENRAAQQRESEFSRTMEAQKPLTDAQVGSFDAQREAQKAATLKTLWETSSAQAKTTFAPIQQRLDEIRNDGGPDMNTRIGTVINEAREQFGSDPEVMRLTAGYVALAPMTLPSDLTRGNEAEARLRATGNVLDDEGGVTGGTLADQNLAFKTTTGEQISAPAISNYEAREMGPKAVKTQVGVATGAIPSADAKLTAATNIKTTAMQTQSAERIAANREAAASGAQGGSSSGIVESDIEDVLTGRNTLFNIRQTMGRSKGAQSYMEKMRAGIKAIDPNFDFIASDAGGKFVSSPFYQRAITAITSVEPNIDTFVKLSEDVGRVGVKGVDKILQSGAMQIGNKKVSNFHEARMIIADEIGLALGQGTVSDMKLQLGMDITDPSVTDEVFASNMKIVKEFIKNRKESLTAQRYQSTERPQTFGAHGGGQDQGGGAPNPLGLTPPRD